MIIDDDSWMSSRFLKITFNQENKNNPGGHLIVTLDVKVIFFVSSYFYY